MQNRFFVDLFAHKTKYCSIPIAFLKNNLTENKNNKYKFQNKALKYTATENKEMHKFETFFSTVCLRVESTEKEKLN
jgi:hypothetical protein